MNGRDDDEATSFDPRSWAGGDDASAPPPPPPPPAKKPTRAEKRAAKAAQKAPAPPSPTPPPPAPAKSTATSIDRDSTSFDPRAWGGDKEDDRPKVERDSTSFDPRAWSGDEPADAPAVERDATSFDPRAWQDENGAALPPPSPPSGGGRGKLIAGALGGVAVLAAGGYFLFARPDAPATPAATATSAAVAPTGGEAAPVGSASRRTLVVAGPDDILPTLLSNSIPKDVATAAAAAARAALGPAPGEVRMVFDLVGTGKDTTLTRLEATRADGAGAILVAGAEGGFATEKLEAKLTTRIEVVRGEMDGDSFYSSAVTAGVDDSLIDAFANAFSFDFNFATDIAAGDIFEAAFARKINPAGQAVGQPELLYVSMTTATKSRALYRFLAPGEKEAGWFDGNGRSTVRALMRTPVNGARITSNFGPRFHPVLHYTRLHGGTDFAAPVGTPVYAAAAGTVLSASPSSCAGNMVIITHDNGWETRYFHLSRYADGIVAGARVTQGMTIGDVGNTGKCTTGPHLHYEVHINGEKVDPMSIDTGSGVALTADGLKAFIAERDRIDQARANSVQ